MRSASTPTAVATPMIAEKVFLLSVSLWTAAKRILFYFPLGNKKFLKFFLIYLLTNSHKCDILISQRGSKPPKERN